MQQHKLLLIITIYKRCTVASYYTATHKKNIIIAVYKWCTVASYYTATQTPHHHHYHHHNHHCLEAEHSSKLLTIQRHKCPIIIIIITAYKRCIAAMRVHGLVSKGGDKTTLAVFVLVIKRDRNSVPCDCTL